jgi:hypothetical protein
MTKFDDNEKIYELLLETLSFYEAMSLEKIIMDIDGERAKEIKDFNKETLILALGHLKHKKLLKVIVENDQNTWLKVFKSKRSWWQKLLPFYVP